MSRRWFLPLIVLVAAAIAGGMWWRSQPARDTQSAAPGWFDDVTQQMRIEFLHDVGQTDKRFLPQVIGSGVGVLDANNDGRMDLLFLQNGGDGGKKNQLYLAKPDGGFVDASAGSGLDFAGHNMGVAIGDVNNDGAVDVLITQYRGARLFLGDGKGKFRDVTKQAGIANPYWGVSAAFADFDRDGKLDLVIVNYVDLDPSKECPGVGGFMDFCHPNNYAGSPVKLFLNRTPADGAGDVRFEDATQKSGLARIPGRGLGVACFDANGDGWPDILCANDAQANHLWINQKDGTFLEEGVVRGVAYNGQGQAQGNMGVALGDIDQDGRLDVFITHLTEETHTLWRQPELGHFRDATAEVGIVSASWRGTGFGTALADFNHDGYVDLAIVNGRVSAKTPSASFRWAAYAERGQLLVGGPKRFEDRSVKEPAMCEASAVARSLALVDFDNDGAMDMVVTTVAGPAKLYRNARGAKGNWLRIRAQTPDNRRDAHGAILAVTADGKKRVALAQPGQSYLASNDPRVHIGLGEATSVDSIEVLWPNGARERFPGGAVNRSLIVTQGTGASIEP